MNSVSECQQLSVEKIFRFELRTSVDGGMRIAVSI